MVNSKSYVTNLQPKKLDQLNTNKYSHILDLKQRQMDIQLDHAIKGNEELTKLHGGIMRGHHAHNINRHGVAGSAERVVDDLVRRTDAQITASG